MLPPKRGSRHCRDVCPTGPIGEVCVCVCVCVSWTHCLQQRARDQRENITGKGGSEGALPSPCPPPRPRRGGASSTRKLPSWHNTLGSPASRSCMGVVPGPPPQWARALACHRPDVDRETALLTKQPQLLGMLHARRRHRRERVISFSVHYPRNIHRNKKNPGILIC